ncbi:meiosis mei2 [Trichoderma arundinaceum]|uniref:Meiosis mei2 n=1 Tax=Trichoderma arundinaceum TaxID=490622 RepID=A0A395NE64_TRIAR|nr:meiosis mei2 [Trichoderma arundinaceum]
MTTVPQLTSRQSQHQGQCQERLMPPSQLQPPLGQFNNLLDSVPYDPDEAPSPGTPQMKAVHPRLELTESPPPEIPSAQVSLPPTDGFSKSNRPKIRPVSGDAVLVTYLGNGRNPEIAQAASHQALPGGDENFEYDDDDISQKSPSQDTSHLAGADIVQRSRTAMSLDNALQAVAAGALQAVDGDLGAYNGTDKPSSDLSASTCQLSIHDDVLPSPNRHVKSPIVLGVRLSAAESGSQSLLSPGSGELPPLQIDSPKYDNNGQSMSLPSIRSTLGDIDHHLPTEMPTPGDRDLPIRHTGDARTFSRSPTVGIPRFPSIPAGGRVSPPMSPNETYQRSLPSPNSLPASSPYFASSNGSVHRSPAEYPNSASNKTLQPGYVIASPPAAIASVADRMSIDGITNPQVGGYECTFTGCTAPPFQTQYLLNSHANVHSQARPHYCPVQGCPRSEGGKGFKRKNEMIRHGLVHDSPGYVCPFCADREHKYPRPDNLQRYLRMWLHKDSEIISLLLRSERAAFSSLPLHSHQISCGIISALPPFSFFDKAPRGLLHFQESYFVFGHSQAAVHSAMTHPNDNPSSPRSSIGGADSFKGTPDTRLTSMTPDGGSKSSSLLKSFARSAPTTSPARLPTGSFRSAVSHLDKDPFITSIHGVGTRLSPTASAFSPFVGNTYVRLPNGDGPISAALSTDMGLSRILVVSSPTQVSTREVEAILTVSMSTTPWLTNVDSGGACFQDVEKEGNLIYGARSFKAHGTGVFIYFTDIRDACAAQTKLHQVENDWKVAFANPTRVAQSQGTHMEMGQDVGDLDSDHRTEMDKYSSYAIGLSHTGQVQIFAVVPPGAVVDSVQTMGAAHRFLQSHGRLFAFVRLSTFPNGSFRAVAEFCDTTAAFPVIQACSGGISTEGIQLFASAYNLNSLSTSGVIEAMQEITISKRADDPDQRLGSVCSSSSQAAQGDAHYNAPIAMYPFMFPTPFTPAMPYMLDSFLPTAQTSSGSPLTPFTPQYPLFGTLYQTPPSPALTAQNNYSPSRTFSGAERADARRQNAMRISRSTYHSTTTHHNHVDINRIRDGIDVRTTIMLRNIPNKVDQAMLKRIIDESSWGKYDFMYLRIDFANDCKNCFKSDKVAEISYATIQGKDCLVQKFRNSSVMLEAPHYRPKLYYTSNGPMPDLAGQEEPFPEPDNQSKMKRSCENAEHVGLFTPNAGQHFRDEQRRRRSQYDRGTRLAALEEYDYETAIQHLYGSTT